MLRFKRLYSSSAVDHWKSTIFQKTVRERDTLSASQFNLVANTLGYTDFHHDKLPPPETVLPHAWHLAYFPPRLPEHELSSDGYEPDWSPPAPFVHRMWAGGHLKWNKDNVLRVGQDVTMESTASDVKLKQGGKRGDAVFIWVDKKIHNKHGWALTESRSWVYVKDQPPPSKQENKKTEELPKPDFALEFKPTPMTLFRFSALTFNSHLIHYDHMYATTQEHQKGCLSHGPMSFALMVNELTKQSGKFITDFKYRCLSPLVVNDPFTICGKQMETNKYDVWISDHTGKLAVKGQAITE